MPCPHSFASLLARTHYAKDAPLVQAANLRTILDKEAHQRESNPTTRSEFTLTKTLDHIQVPIDQGRRIESFRIFREYGAYAISHIEVYDALIFFFGNMTFAPSAQPSDALALAAAAAFMMHVAERTAMNQNILEETRTMANKAAHFSSISAQQIDTCLKSFEDKETVEQFWTLYGILINRTRDTCTMVTDFLWQMCQYMTCKLLHIQMPGIPAILNTHTRDFMTFVAGVHNLDLCNGDSVALNTDGMLVYKGGMYKAVGYCQDGLMICPVSSNGDTAAKSLALDQVLGYYLKDKEVKFFFKIVPHHNMKSFRDSCAGCSAATISKDDRMFVYTNPLVSSDLKGAKEFEVHKDGKVSFSAQELVLDQPKGRLVRTSYKRQLCEAYDIHSLLGFNTYACPGLSSLFSYGIPPKINSVKSEGIFVRSIIGRMDDYTTDADRKITSILHGSAQKWAKKNEGGYSVWSDTRNSSFTLDDVVK